MSALWTPECEAHLVELYRAGSSAGAIATALGLKFGFQVSRSAVIGKAKRLEKANALGLWRKPAAPVRVRPVVLEDAGQAVQIQINVSPTPQEPVRSDDAPFVCEAGPEGTVGLLELTRGQCRYPFGISAHRTTYCGKPKREGCSYCEEHAKACLVKPPASINLRRRKRRSYVENRRDA